jgi:DMSO/TMAO reductase YedYZ molybdopterin-dependent catalytic subunit
MDESRSDGPHPSANETNVPGDEQSQAQGVEQVCEPQREQEPIESAAERDAAEKTLTQSEWRKLNRRELLKLTPIVLAGAFVIPGLRTPLLREGVALSDWASGLLVSKARLAPTFAPSAVVPFEKFPYNGYDVLDPNVDLDNWTLTVEGKVRQSGEYTLAQIRDLPKITQNVRHVCVEGWDAIGSFGGVRISDFLRLVGADSRARFLEVACADDYYESVDMDTAMHPQSLLCYEMYGKPLDRGHGAPLRLHFPTKLGYKHAKYLTAFRVTDVLKPKRGYWVDQGYSWFAGL